jgi:hypothetical protein
MTPMHMYVCTQTMIHHLSQLLYDGVTPRAGWILCAPLLILTIRITSVTLTDGSPLNGIRRRVTFVVPLH